jgi:hypothetical protein
MNRRVFEAAIGLVLLVSVTVVSTGPSRVFGASTIGGVCLNCDNVTAVQCKAAGDTSSWCSSDEIVSDCTSDAEENDGVCSNDENDPPGDSCHNRCNVDNEYCEDNPDLW